METRGWIAQSVEQRPEKPCVVGSIPTLATSGFSRWGLPFADFSEGIQWFVKDIEALLPEKLLGI